MMMQGAESCGQRAGCPKRCSVLLLVALVGCVLVGCAKKMLPPSPDRFAPNLKEIVTRNRVRLELVFDEDLDPAKLSVDSFGVTSQSGQSLVVRGVAVGRRAGTVDLWTEPQEPVLYRILGRVEDRTGNVRRFSGRFRGSDRPDTIAPRITGITPDPGSAGRRRPVVRVEFSEPVDTTAEPSFFFVPGKWDSVFGLSWKADWQSFALIPGEGNQLAGVRNNTLAPEDTAARLRGLPPGIIYFLLPPGVQDLEGNRSREPAFTYFTADSVLNAVTVRGRVVSDRPWKTGLVFFHSPVNSGLAVVLADGSFSTRLAAGDYKVRSVADTDGDDKAELSTQVIDFRTEQESLVLRLEPETTPKPLRQYREP